jgi:L-aminopeptidase/D-esterase-like protein
VNCLGDVIDSKTGEILAGTLAEDMRSFLDAERFLISEQSKSENSFGQNTTIGVIATNASLTKGQATKVAAMAQDGFARAIRPAHTMFDGDTIFCIATGLVAADVNVAGLLAARTMEQSVINAVKEATPLCGLTCHSDLKR